MCSNLIGQNSTTMVQFYREFSVNYDTCACADSEYQALFLQREEPGDEATLALEVEKLFKNEISSTCMCVSNKL